MKKYDSYKDSGVEWIGEVPENWEVSKVKFLFDTQKGKTPKNLLDKIEENSLVYLAMDYLRGEPKQVFFVSNNENVVLTDENETLLLWDGSNAGEFLKSKKGVLSSTMALIKSKIIYNQFQWYSFKSFESILKDSCNGMGIPHVDGKFFRGSAFLVPPIEEQTIIANYLDHKTTQIEHLIAKKEQFIQLLEEERVAVINQAVTKGLDPSVPMKDSGIDWLGEIPAHWEVKKLKLLANIQGRIGFKGYTVGDLVSEGEGALTLGAKHIDKFNKLNLSNPEFISWDKYYESPEIMVQIGDIILTQRGTLGKVVLITEDIGKATINPSMVILSNLKANDYFLYYFFNSDYFKSWIDLTNTATAVPMISQGQLGNLKLVLPNNDEQNHIARSIQKSTKKIDDIIVKAQQEIELLKEYKTALISEVVTGKVDVRNEKLN